MKRITIVSLMLGAALLLASCRVVERKDAPEESTYMAAVEVDAMVRKEMPTLNDDERSLLTWLVACEAGDRPFMAQVCVAAVLLNRLESDGGDVRELVFESGDFLSVVNGHVTGSPTASQKKTKKYRVGEMALDEALAGRDPTGGALYYAEADDKRSNIAIGYECGGLVFGS